MKLAQELQGKVMDYINDAFFAEEDLNLNNLTYTRFMKEYDRARNDGTLDELDRQLAAILSPVIQMVLSQPPEGQQ